MIRNFAAASLFTLSVTPAYAVDITFGAEAFFSYQAEAFDEFGSPTTPSFDATGVLSVNSSGTRDNVNNTSESLGESDRLTLTNTSASDIIFLSWNLDLVTEIYAFIAPDTVVGPTDYELTSFAGMTDPQDIGSFSAAVSSYACSAADLADPLVSCDGVSAADVSSVTESDFLELLPGESFFVEIETAPLLIVSTESPSAIPLPAGGVLLLSGLFGIGLLRRRSTRHTQ